MSASPEHTLKVETISMDNTYFFDTELIRETIFDETQEGAFNLEYGISATDKDGNPINPLVEGITVDDLENCNLIIKLPTSSTNYVIADLLPMMQKERSYSKQTELERLESTLASLDAQKASVLAQIARLQKS